MNLGQIFAVAVIASAIWWQSDSVSDIAGSLFFISIQQAFNGLNVSAARPSHPVRFSPCSVSLARDRRLEEKSIVLRLLFLGLPHVPSYRPGYRMSSLPHVRGIAYPTRSTIEGAHFH